MEQRDRPADEIEVTPAMVSAGVHAGMKASDYVSGLTLEVIVAEVYEAMERTRKHCES